MTKLPCDVVDELLRDIRVFRSLIQKEHCPMSILPLIAAISADSAQKATDLGTLATTQAAVVAAQAVVDADTSVATVDDASLSAALSGTPGVYVVNPDTTASIYEFSPSPPGYTIVVVPLAS